MGLVILTRPGIQVVCGVVLQVVNGDIWLENECRCGERVVRKQIVLHVPVKQVKRLNPTYGSFLVATIHPTEETLALSDGIVDMNPSYVYEATAYNIRYTGAFDFKAIGEYEEEHVFCGNVLEKSLYGKGTLVQVGWRRNGIQEVRNLYFGSDIREKLGNKAVFATGREHTAKSDPNFKAHFIKKINTI